MGGVYGVLGGIVTDVFTLVGGPETRLLRSQLDILITGVAASPAFHTGLGILGALLLLHINRAT